MQKSQIDITAEELLGVLREYSSVERRTNVGEGFTRGELQELLEWGEKKTLRYLRRAVADGSLVPTYVGRKNMHNESCTVKGYMMAESPPEAA